MTKPVNTDAKETDVDEAIAKSEKQEVKAQAPAVETVKPASGSKPTPTPQPVSQPIPPAKSSSPEKSESQVRQRQSTSRFANNIILLLSLYKEIIFFLMAF